MKAMYCQGKLALMVLAVMLLAVPQSASVGQTSDQKQDKTQKSDDRTERARGSRGRRGRGGRSRGGRGGRTDNAPKVGQAAPDFTLKSLDGKSETKLSAFKGKKPVVLFFGSYT